MISNKISKTLKKLMDHSVVKWHNKLLPLSAFFVKHWQAYRVGLTGEGGMRHLTYPPHPFCTYLCSPEKHTQKKDDCPAGYTLPLNGGAQKLTEKKKSNSRIMPAL